ncbi:MAG: polysaccharide biosynthesis protein [Gammaproteobacteria bacterium]
MSRYGRFPGWIMARIDELTRRLRDFLVDLPRPLKRLALAASDFVLIAAAVALAVAFTHSHSEFAPGVHAPFPWAMVLLLGLAAVPVFAALGLYRAVTRFISSRIIVSVVFGMAALATVLLVYAWLMPHIGVDFGTSVAFWIFGFLLVLGVRFVARELLLSRPRVCERALIYGAGMSGARLAALLQRESECVPVAFIDDSIKLQGSVVAGLVVHGSQDIERLIKVHHVKRILLAMPSVSHKRRGEIVAELELFPVHVQTVPDMHDLVSGRARFEDLREVEVEDLLGRDAIPPYPDLIGASVTGRTVMVTGAGGSIGSELCRQVAGLGATRLVLVERSEAALYAIDQELAGLVAARHLALEVVPVLGSVGNRERMAQVMHRFGVRTVYHAAAYKHVPLVEYNMAAGIRNNVFGTQALAEAAEQAGVENFVLVSTDKAVNPTNVMGASKRLAEIILQGIHSRGARMCISIVRFGNVLASSGSVVLRFREQVRAGGPVTVTHPEITRYFMTIEEAVQLVIQAGAMGGDAEVFLLDMGQPVRILDLARKMIKLSGRTVRDAHNRDGDIEIVYTGLRPGEKLYEELLISGNASGTDHPRIWKGVEEGVDAGQVETAIDALRVAIRKNDCKAMREILLSVVREYQPPEEVADVLYSAPAAYGRRRGDGGDVVELPVARILSR